MAFVHTMLSGAVGEKFLGKSAPNKPDDVRKVRLLLKKAFGLSTPAAPSGDYDQELADDIVEFQRAWGGTPDGTIDPHGPTLKRLDRVTTPVTLKPISLAYVLRHDTKKARNDGGGYDIAYQTCDGGPLPPADSDYGVRLTLMNDLTFMDVSDRPAHDVMSVDNLGELLDLIDRLGAWGGVPVLARIQLRYLANIVTTSNPQTLTTPVLPHNGRMLPLDESNNGPKLTYQGDAAAGDFHGRMFAQVPGFAKNLFIYGGKLETRNEFRGFDCITYVGTTCGASNFHMADSADLVGSLDTSAVSVQHTETDKHGKEHTTTVVLDHAEPRYVKEFFEDATTGSYVIYTTGHIVLVIDGDVYEFKASAPSGYNVTPVDDWLEPYHSMKMTVRQLAARPARSTL